MVSAPRAGSRLCGLGGISLVLLLCAGAASSASATPRYAARYGQNCHLCHHNPTGGGMRSLYASQYIVPVELAMRASALEASARLDPQIGENVTVGADLRTLYMSAARTPGENGFFAMQTDVYLAFQLDDRWSAYIDRGQSGTEAFGLAYVIPCGGYLKAGRFAPGYGWQFEDHTAFVRQELGSAPPGHTDTGVEMGLYPGRLAATFGLFNGAPGAARDTDRRLATTGRLLYRTRVGPAQAALGASIWRSDEECGLKTVGGPLGSLAWGPLVWLGEFGWSGRDRDEGHDVTAWVVSQEVACRMTRGCDLRGTYNFHDPDLNRRGGAQERLGIGVDLLPRAYFGLQAMINFHRREVGPDLPGRDDVQTTVIGHFLY